MVNYKVQIPFAEYSKHRCNISATFKDLVTNIKKRIPDLKLDYAYLNTDDPMERIQMMLLFKFKADGGPKGIVDKYLVYIANTFSYFSLEGYDICKQRGKLNEWFEDFQDKPVVYPEQFIKDMINDTQGKLSWDNEDPEKYWKNPKNAKEVATTLDKYASVYHTIAGKM